MPYWKACLSEAEVQKLLKKHFIVVSCPYSHLNGVSFGVTVFAHTKDAKVFHQYRYGTGNHLIGRIYTQKYHDQRTKEVVQFLKECVVQVAKVDVPTVPAPTAIKNQVRVVQAWSGILKDETLREVPRKNWRIPSDGILTRQRELEQLWKSWRPDEKVPTVDFIQNFVVLVTSTSGNPVRAVPQLNEKGELKVYAFGEVTGEKGFGYQIAVIPRKGVKSVSGKRPHCGRYNCGCHFSYAFNPRQTETKALHQKLRGVCWGDLANYECFKDDAEMHKRMLARAYRDCAKTNKILLYIANTGG